RAALFGQPQALPALARLARRAEGGVEERRAARLRGGVDRVQRDLADAWARVAAARADATLVDDREVPGVGRPAPQPARDRRAAAAALGPGEGALGVDGCRSGHEHGCVVSSRFTL